MSSLTTKSDQEILALADGDVRDRLGKFIREFNKREWSVRVGADHPTFESYVQNGYEHSDEFGTGFVVDGQPVPYFHPNRSFHDEIIWLNSNLYYEPDVSFEDKLINSAIVKFYGPANTLDIITQNTGSRFINHKCLVNDPEYEMTLLTNVDKAFVDGEKIWGTTELRTSLQTASRNYGRLHSPINDIKNVPQIFRSLYSNLDKNQGLSEGRRMMPSDMIVWVKHLAERWIPFYKSKPDMKESFEFLTSTRGIGNYYGYHFSSNLARMPGVGANRLIDVEFGDLFGKLGISHGNLDENSDYCIAGPGATATLTKLFKGFPKTQTNLMRALVAIRNNQEEFFGIAGNPVAEQHLREASELGRFTTFGIEISCCQFNVFERAAADGNIARKRAAAPISKITKEKT